MAFFGRRRRKRQANQETDAEAHALAAAEASETEASETGASETEASEPEAGESGDVRIEYVTGEALSLGPGASPPPIPADAEPPTEAEGTLDEDGVDLPAMVAAILAAAPAAADSPPDLVLLRAQWCDLCRDARVSRPDADVFAELADDEQAQRRAGLLMNALLSQDAPADLLLEGAEGRDADGHARCSLVLPATQLDLLRPRLIATSDLRAEELARAFAASLGVGVRGEDEATSEAALRRLDYRRLLAGADRAKAKAAEKMDYLKQLYQAQEDARPRGKW